MKFDWHVERQVKHGVETRSSFVPWDTEIFEFPVAQIEQIAVRYSDDPIASIQQPQLRQGQQVIHLASYRLDSRDLRASMLLDANAFRFIEMLYSLPLAPIMVPGEPKRDLFIEGADEPHPPYIEAIAGNAFATRGYKLDRRIDPVDSYRRYRISVRNSFDLPRQQTLNADFAGQIFGFFIAEERPDRSAYWHLTVIAPAAQGKNVGKRPWSAMAGRHQQAGFSRLETTIFAQRSRHAAGLCVFSSYLTIVLEVWSYGRLHLEVLEFAGRKIWTFT